jgi:hypothetical protein
MGNIGETAKNKFLLPLQQNDASSVYNSFHPELKGEFELQLFRQFVRALNEGLGTFVKVSPQHIEKGVAYSSALGKTKSQSGELEFSNGNLEYSVTFGAGDQIIAFSLSSDKAPTAFVKEIETAPYVERSLSIINAFYARDLAEIRSHFHDALRDKVDENYLLQMINKELNRAELGKFIAATPRDIPDVAQTTEKDGVSRLVLYFNIERELGTGLGKIIWVFPSLMKGEVIGFEFCSEILSMKNEAQAGDGLKLAAESLHDVVNLDTNKFVKAMHTSLKEQVDPDVLKLQFKRFFSNGGPMTESIEESIKKATEVIEPMSNGMKTLKVNGSLAYEQFNMLYTFSWVSGLLTKFNVKPDPMSHVPTEADPELVREVLVTKTKNFLLSILRMNKLQEAKEVVEVNMIAELDKLQKQFRDMIRSSFADELKFDIQVGEKSPEEVCRVQVTLSLGTPDSTFVGWIDWQLATLMYFVVDWAFKSGAKIEREKQEALRAPLRESLHKNGLRVYVEKAVNLAAADSNGFSDPYVVLSLYTPNMDKRVVKAKSKVIKKNLNPIWEEMLTLTHTNYNDLIVKVEVWDKDKITDDFLGQIVWPFDEIFKMVLDKGEVVMPFALKDKKGGNNAQGEIYMKFVFKS